ncbi:glycosyl transferase [Roseibium aquae]|uniref:Glycosyl transferase n=1 Tax=Roseibium aquae TaxID=1323746 RepID=A0A916TF05_9HYPH|nr:glycosyltransferase family 4 protein [Roseibium aquae]GGB41143.1 glycosyl transferase [Roseibium aquae]
MKIAFTAPMKPLDHPEPSGDRTMGRLFVRAARLAGHEVRVASTFRAWSKSGGEAQRHLKEAALEEAHRIGDTWEEEGYRPDIFLTYHVYHKAPDWIGPVLADRFNLPYAILEASRAPKHQEGAFRLGFADADRALHRADMVAALHEADAQCLRPVLASGQLTVLLPFIDTQAFEVASNLAKPLANAPLDLLAVGMMRPGDKERSYRVLAEALERVSDLPWHLTIIGDGMAAPDVRPLFPPQRTRFLGTLPPSDLPAEYARHDLFVWPAIREAFGLVFLEAQAAGLGVVAGDAFGVPSIVRHGVTGLLAPEGDAEALAVNLRKVLSDPQRADDMGLAARDHIAARHTLAAGSERLDAFLEQAVANFTRHRGG